MPKYPSLTPFIVHGHDHVFRDEVVRFLQNDLGLKPPIVLDGVASAGLTVIEKFEREASRCDLAIILLTPDDEATTSGGIAYRTARPNVLFELGYFMARFGRKSGRTLIIYRKGLDIPSDLSGVVYIDASQGITSPSVVEKLALELNHVVQSPRPHEQNTPLAAGTFNVTGRLNLTGL